ncbi:MAG: hypothetical protein ACI4PU_09150 [Intestinibacter sp.]
MIYIDMYINSEKIEFNIFRNFANNKKIIKRNELVLPNCYSTAQKLNYIRNLTSIFIDEYGIKYYKVDIGSFRDSYDVESKDFCDKITNSIKIEGVLEELFLSRGVKLWK